jgi:predicted transcriptional regulator
MPYVSDKQRKFFHTKTAKRKGITAAMVEEYDKSSKGKKLPKKVKKKVGKKK